MYAYYIGNLENTEQYKGENTNLNLKNIEKHGEPLLIFSCVSSPRESFLYATYTDAFIYKYVQIDMCTHINMLTNIVHFSVGVVAFSLVVQLFNI